MSTFLQIVQAVGRDSGTTSTAAPLATVVGATGRWLKIVQFVIQAWLDIQNARTDWQWMIRETEKALADGTRRYTAAGWSITRFSAWVQDQDSDDLTYRPFSIRDPDLGLADESALYQIDYRVWRDRYGRGDQSQEQRPTCYAISPAREVCVGPVPDQEYTLRFEYRLAPQILAADADTPELPAEFHDVIKWKAQLLLAEHDERPGGIATARNSYSTAYLRLVNAQVPKASV